MKLRSLVESASALILRTGSPSSGSLDTVPVDPGVVGLRFNESNMLDPVCDPAEL